jgi:hypothetical protein
MKEILKQLCGIILITVLCLQIVGPVAPAFAQNGAEKLECESGDITPECLNVGRYLITKDQQGQPKEIGAYVVRFTNFLALTIGSFAFLAIVIGGIFLLTAGGREEQITRGKDMIKYAIIGLVFAMLAYFIVAFVQSILFENAPTA